MQCDSCKKDFPQHILSGIFYRTQPSQLVCGICALAILYQNTKHVLGGICPNRRIEYYRQAALRHLAKTEPQADEQTS